MYGHVRMNSRECVSVCVLVWCFHSFSNMLSLSLLSANTHCLVLLTAASQHGKHMGDLLERLCNKFNSNGRLWCIWSEFVLARGDAVQVRCSLLPGMIGFNGSIGCTFASAATSACEFLLQYFMHIFCFFFSGTRLSDSNGAVLPADGLGPGCHVV
jgi:hypothetical protein